MGALDANELITGYLGIAKGSLEVEISSVLESGKMEKNYGSFFAKRVESSLIRRIKQHGVLMAGQIQRNLKEWWANRESLLSSNAA